MTCILGVDPGAGGAIALLDIGLNALIVRDMPVVVVRVGRHDRRQINETLLAHMLGLFEPDAAFIERVHALPGQGVTSAFTFGMAYGLVRGILAAMHVPTQLVTPQEWKRSFRLGPDKREARLIAARMLPANASDFARARDDGRAEAALLALFGAAATNNL